MDFITSIIACCVTTVLVVCYGVRQWYNQYTREHSKERFAKELKASKKDIVYLYIPSRWEVSINPNPSCTKVETFLRFGKIPYIVRQVSWWHCGYWGSTFGGCTAGASINGDASLTVPCIIYNGLVSPLGNSQEIIEFLTKKLKLRMDADAICSSPAKRSSCSGDVLPVQTKLCLALGVRRAVERNCFPSLARTFMLDHPELLKAVLSREPKHPPRLLNKRNGFGVRTTIGGVSPPAPHYLLRPLLAWRQEKKCQAALQSSSFVKEVSAVRYQEEFLQDVQMFEALISSNGPRGYILSRATPTSYDAGVFAVLHQLHQTYTFFVKPIREGNEGSSSSSYFTECEAMTYLEQSEVLLEYVSRVEGLYYPDLVKGVASAGDEDDEDQAEEEEEDKDDGAKPGGLGVMNRWGKQEFLQVTHYGKKE